MKSSEPQLPSNKKFGFFFSVIFFISSSYFLYSSYFITGIILVILALIFFFITIINSDLLLSLNKIWMKFGLLLGKIISPFVLGIIFFGLFTPYAILMRLLGRDELRLKEIKNNSNWIRRKKDITQTNFKRQF